jgi:hypothetical protein
MFTVAGSTSLTYNSETLLTTGAATTVFPANDFMTFTALDAHIAEHGC